MSKRRKEEVTPPTFNEVVQQLSKGRIDETVVNQVQGRPVPQQTEFDLEETGQTWADQTPAEIRDQRAARQPNSRAIANSLFQIGTTIAGDTVAGIGYLGELKDIQDIVAGTETEWGNWLTNIGNNIKEWGQDVAPVYASESAMQGFKPWDGEWWATNIPSIGSTFALMLPAAGAAGITSKLLGRAGNAAKIAGKLSTTQKVLPGISAAVTSRHIENMMEGKEVFDTVYNEAIQAGKSDPEARKIAGNAASQSYNTNYINLLTDIPQYLAAGGFFGKLAGGTGKKAIGKELLSSVGQESVEEALQFVISKEAERTGRLDIEGKEEDGTNFGQRLTNYLQDPQLWTASFFGALGGGMFTAGSRAIEKTVDLIATDPAERQDKAMMNLVEDAIDKGDFNQLKTAVVEMRKANPEDLGMSPEVYNKNLDKLDQLAKHAESFYSSAPAEFREEATKLGVKAKKLELDKIDTQTQIEAIKANVSDTKAFDAYMNELQLAALSNNTSKQAKEYKAQLEKSLEDVEYNKSDFAAYSSQMRQAAKKMAISSVEAMKTNEELMKYETPEGQQEIAKAKAKQAEAKAKQEYQEALAKAEQATTPEEIENSPITDEDKGRLFSEKLVQDKKNIAQAIRAIPKNSIESREQAESLADSILSETPFLNSQLDSSRRNDLVNKLLQEYGQAKTQKEVQSQQEQTPQKSSRIEAIPEGAQSHYTRRNGQREDVSKRTDANKGAGWYRQNGTRVGDLDYINEATDNYFSDTITDPETGQAVTEGEDITSWGDVQETPLSNIESQKAGIQKRRREELEYWQAEDRQKKIKEGREITKKVLKNLKKKYPSTTLQGIVIRLLEKIIDFNTFAIINSEGLKLPGGKDATKFGALATGEGMAMRQDRIDALLEGNVDAVKTFIHELVHTFTKEKVGEYQMEKSGLIPGYKAKLTEKEKKALTELERIYNKVKQQFPSSTEYGLTNLDEFLAEAFSNYSFQATLKELKSEGKKTSLFKEWLNAISDLFYESLVKWSKRFNKPIPQKSEIIGILEDIMGWTEDLIGEELLKLEVTTEEINAKYDAELASLETQVPTQQDIAEGVVDQEATDLLNADPVQEIFDEKDKAEAQEQVEEQVENTTEDEPQTIEPYDKPEQGGDLLGTSREAEAEPNVAVFHDIAMAILLPNGKYKLYGYGKPWLEYTEEQLSDYILPKVEGKSQPLKYKANNNPVPTEWQSKYLNSESNLEMVRAFAESMPDWRDREVFIEINDDTYKDNANEIKMHLIMVRDDTKKVYLGLLRNPANTADSAKLAAIREQIYAEYVAQGKPEMFRSGVTTRLSQVSTGRVWNTNQRNKPADVLGDDFIAGIGITAGETTELVTNGTDIRRGSGRVAPVNNPTAGGVYLAVDSADGGQIWYRAFTKRLDSESYIQENELPVFEEIFGYEQVTYLEAIRRLLGVAQSNPDLWKNRWSDIRNEIRSIVRFNNKGKIQPDFRANFAEFLNEKHEGSIDNYLTSLNTRFNFYGLPLQVDSRKINTGNYNKLILNNRVEIDVNPDQHTHSTQFSVDLDSVELGVVEKQDFENDFEGESLDGISLQLGGEPIGTKEQAVAYLESILPNVPVHILDKTLRIGNQEAFGYFSNAGITLLRNAGLNTAKHEAAHIVFEFGLSEREQRRLLEQAKSSFSLTKDDLDRARLALSKLNSDRTPEQYALIEKIMEEFETYTISGDTSLAGRVKSIFKRLLEYLKMVFTNRISLDGFYYRIDSGLYKNIDLSSVSSDYQPAFKLHGFRSEAERQTRVKSTVSMLDRIIKSIADVDKISIDDAYRKALANLDNIFTGDMLSYGGSIKQRIEQRATKVNKPESFNLYLSAIENPDFRQSVLAKMSTRGVKVKFEPEDISTENEDAVENWQKSVFQYSQLKSMSARLRRALSVLPVLKTPTVDVLTKMAKKRPSVIVSNIKELNELDNEVNHIVSSSSIVGSRLTGSGWHKVNIDGTKHYLRDVFVPEYDDLGFIKMHEGSKIYGDLQYKIGDSASPRHMMDRLNNLQDYHYKFLLSKLDSSLATELWYYVGQKNQPEFNDIVNVDGIYGIRSSGTDNVLNKILNDSFDYFSNSNYYDNGEVKNADKIKTLVNKVRKSESPDAIVELNNMLFGLDNNVLLNMNVNDYLTKMTNAALAIADGNLDFNNRQFKNFFKIVAEKYPVNFQSSHINIEGEKIFEWINSSFLGKMVAKLKSGEFNWDFYRNDPMYSHLMNKGVIDPKVWAKARWSIIGGVKHNKKGAGVTYNNFSDKDSAIALYTMVKEGWYNTSILSDAPVMTAINLGKKSTTEAVNDLFELAIAEDIRNKNIDKHKSKFGRYAAEFSFFEGDEMPTKSDIQRQIKEEADKLERKFMELGLIEDGKMVIDGSTIDTSIMQNLVANYMLNEAQIILMTQGDPAFYKGSADFFKRAKEVWSPGNYMDTTASYEAPDGTVTTYPSSGKYNVGILEDIKMPSPQLDEIRKALAGRDQDTIDRLTAAYGYSNDKDDKGKPIVRLSDGSVVPTENPNLADAQGIIDMLTYKMRLLGENRWSHAKEFAYRLITQGISPRSKNLQTEIDAFTTDQQIRDEIKKELGSIVFQPIKPFYFAHHLLNNVLVYPVQNKDSEYLLTPMFAQGNPELESVLTKMGYTKTDTGWVLDVEGRMNGRYVDKFVFESGIKIPLGDQIDTLENIDDTKYIQFNWSDYRRQMETPAHYVDTDNNFGTQIMKLIFADVETEDLLEAKREYNRLIQEDIRRSLSELKSRLYKEGELDTQAVVNILREEVLERGLSDQYIEALEENTLDAIEGVNTKLPLYHPLHSYRIEAIINSLYKNRVTKQKFLQGVALYNVSSYGLSKKPKIVYENGRIKHIQAYAPVYTKALEKYRLEDGTIDIDTIRKQAPEMLEGLVYRIPTEDKYSMFHIEIIGFTDDASGGGIILPPEVTTIAGLDFDIDKVYGFFNAVDNPYDKAIASIERKIQAEFDKTDITSLTDEDWNNVFGKLYEDRAEFEAEVRQVIADDIAGKGKYEKLKRRQEQWQAKADSDNRKLELMRQVLSHKSMIENILTPGGFEQIRSVSNVVKEAQGISDDLSINKMTDTISVVRRMNTGKALTGIAANYNVARALWQGHDLSLDSGFMFDKRMYTDLSSVTINGIRPGRSIAEILAAAVDNGKDPLAEFINLNTYTADLALTMLATGMSIETVALFMSQPIVKQYANYYFNNDQEEAGLPTMSEVDEEFQPHPLTTEELKEGLSEMDINAPYDPDAIVPELQLKVIENFVHYMQIAKPVSMLVGRTKIPDSGTGPTQADNVDSIVKYDEAQIPDPKLNSIAMINGAINYLRANTFMNTFYESTFPEVQEVFKRLGFPKLTRGSSFYRVMDKLKNISGDFLSANEINRLLTHFLDYLSYGFETYNPSNLVNLNETVKDQLFKYKKYLKDNNLKNDFVDRLSFKDGAIQFNGIIGVESTEETYLRNLWYEMLSNNQNIDGFTIADLANNLIKYSFFRTGFRLAGKKGFSHLHPVGYYATLVDSNGQSFNQYITKQIQSNNGNDPAHDVFVEQYIRNNYRNLSYVPFVEVEQGKKLQYNPGHKQYIKTNKGLYKVNHVERTVKFIPDLGQYYQAPLDPMDIVMGAKPKEPVELFKEYYPRIPAPTSVFNKEAVPIEKVKPEIKPIIPVAQQSQPVQETTTVKPTQQPVTQTTPVGKVTGMFDSSDKTLKPGAVVTYNNKKYILWNINNANKAQLIQTDGTKFSGTPNLDKLTVDGNYPIANYNGTDYIVTNNGNIYSLANGNRRWTSDAQASIDARNSIYSQVGYTEIQQPTQEQTWDTLDVQDMGTESTVEVINTAWLNYSKRIQDARRAANLELTTFEQFKATAEKMIKNQGVEFFQNKLKECYS